MRNRNILLTLTRAAELLGVAESTIYTAASRGEIVTQAVEGLGGRDSRVVTVLCLDQWRRARIEQLEPRTDPQSARRRHLLKQAGPLCTRAM